MTFNMWRDYLDLNATLRAAMAPRQVAEDASIQEEAPDPGTAPSIQQGSNRRARRSPPEAVVPPSGHPDSTPCTFCKHNGEAPRLYNAHSLKNKAGRVVCPILRSYTCPQCGASGDKAHTRRFCPLTKDTYTSVYHTTTKSQDGKKAK